MIRAACALIALMTFLPASRASILPWRNQVEQQLQQHNQLIQNLIVGKPAPQQPQPLQILLIPGEPRQALPIPGDPRQQLPVPGNPIQPLPIQGQPQQPLPIGGQPIQPIPITPPPGTQPQQLSIYVRALYRPAQP